jgi:hypothetical protein
VRFPIGGFGAVTVSADIPMPRSEWHTISMDMTVGNTQYNATPQSLFEIVTAGFVLMADTFRAPSCTNCHSLGNSDAISNFHVSRGAWAAPNPAAQPGDSSKCDACHASKIGGTGKWFSPPDSTDMNWKYKTLKDICLAVLNHTGGYEGLMNHVQWDPRLNWSFSGALPDGKTEAIPPPYSSNALSYLVMMTGWGAGFDTTDPTGACKNLEWVPY